MESTELFVTFSKENDQVTEEINALVTYSSIVKEVKPDSNLIHPFIFFQCFLMSPCQGTLENLASSNISELC